MNHPRRASHDPLKGATPAAWQSQFRGVPGLMHFAPVGRLAPSAIRSSATGMLRVEAVAHRRRANAGFGRAA